MQVENLLVVSPHSQYMGMPSERRTFSAYTVVSQNEIDTNDITYFALIVNDQTGPTIHPIYHTSKNIYS